MTGDQYSGKGIVANIQRFSIHDGPGIRTTVFLKGCPLSCGWCANPETMKLQPDILMRSGKCIACGKCIEVCPQCAITLTEEKDRKIAWDKCDQCLKCAEVCPSGAIERVGECMSAKEVMEEVIRDRDFYRRSKGGMTLSGGEPLLQWEFALDLFREAKKEGLHAALDTCGLIKGDIFEKFLENVNLVLFDIKHLDSVLHKKATGVSNELILDNLKKAMSNNSVKTWIRSPVIPVFNDSEGYFTELAKYLLSLERPVEKVSLLPFHNLAESKWTALGICNPYTGVPTPMKDKMERLKNIFESRGLPVSIGR